ncbi:MAG: methionine synthase [Candidatus Melainabacteria bacterium]|nr:methionine synthase [Candidatus Melainabacteria bacterium]
MKSQFLEIARSRGIIFDGAMGTSLFNYDLTAEDYGGDEFEGCPEQLNYHRPDILEEIHSKFFEAGADVVETNSFGSSQLVLAEYGIAEKSYEVSKLAASIARKVADRFTKENPEKPRFVAGSIGPGTKLASLGNISFDELYESYKPQVQGLIDGGVDLLLIETCQDPLQIKACINACLDVMVPEGPAAWASSQNKLPIQVQVTVETMGTLLVGSDIASALTTISAYPVDIVGMNCATGPAEMREHIQYLAEESPFMISCLPNAGIPENVGGHAHFPLDPEVFSTQLSRFVKDFNVSVVGGCCGTTYEHIRMLAEKLAKLDRDATHVVTKSDEVIQSVSSLYNSVSMLMEPRPLIVGERTNANGSKLFRDLLGKEDYDGIVDIAKDQVAEGAHVLDVCTAYVGRDETRDMTEVIKRINTQVNIPIMVDSTEYPVLEAALKYISAKPIINSINLEDGEERVAQIAALAKRFGAALVVLTIDEDGMAKTAQKKLEVASRLYEMLVNKYGIDPRNLIYDTLTFTLASGDEEMRNAGIETIEAIRLIKAKYPEVKTVLGLSNISFGIDAKLRPSLNSVFLHECIQAGLDMAIASARKLYPMAKIEPKIKEICLDLIYDRRREDYDPLHSLVLLAENVKQDTDKNKDPYADLTLEEILAQRIVDGNKTNIDVDLDAARAKGHAPLDIINIFLMNGMKVVGDRFRAGEMQLPFVLQSATCMKTAVAHLEQFMDKADGDQSKGSFVLATVKGDVHDIGKNLVDIILTNNGYTVHNLGIKQPVDAILQAVEEHKADVVGMSGLLVKSTLIMKQNLELMNERGIDVPVILGGSALTRRYVEEDCANVYGGTVFYGFDAFTDLSLMERICSGPKKEKERYKSYVENLKQEFYKTREKSTQAQINPETDSPYDAVEDAKETIDCFSYTDKVSNTRVLEDLPQAPFLGDKLIDKDIELDEVWKYLNVDALIIGQWNMGKGKQTKEAYAKQRAEVILPTLERIKSAVKAAGYMKPQFTYGYYECEVDPENPNRLVIASDEGEKEFIFPRQTNKDNLCLTDYFRGGKNIVAFQIVTIGEEAATYVRSLYEQGDYEEYLYHYGLATETTEALAEYAHTLIRKELGFQAEDHEETAKLIKSNYHGMRFSFGYPACPRLEDQKQLFELLKPERIGLELSEEWQIHPEHSTSAIVVHHPDAKYFNVK